MYEHFEAYVPDPDRGRRCVRPQTAIPFHFLQYRTVRAKLYSKKLRKGDTQNFPEKLHEGKTSITHQRTDSTLSIQRIPPQSRVGDDDEEVMQHTRPQDHTFEVADIATRHLPRGGHPLLFCRILVRCNPVLKAPSRLFRGPVGTSRGGGCRSRRRGDARSPHLADASDRASLRTTNGSQVIGPDGAALRGG